MSNDDVRPSEMNAPHDFDEQAIEALLAGAGSKAAPQVADLVSDMRVAYTSIPPTAGAELSAFMALASTAPAASLVSRRFERMRASTMARISAAAAVVMAATGGLAVAQALPGPVQDLVSHVGIGGSSHHHSDAATDVSSTTTTTDGSSTSTVSTPPTTAANHGAVVSGVAHDDSNVGCEHGAAVSAVASDGRSNNDGANAAKSNPQNSSHDGSCATPTTVDTSSPSSTSTTPSTTDNHSGEHGGTTPTSTPESSGGNQGAGHGSQPDSGKGGD